MFSPHVLRTVEVDVENKIFKINGEEFGKSCTGFTIECKPSELSVRMEIDTKVVYSTYSRSGELKESRDYQTNTPWFSVAANGSDEQGNDIK